MLTIIINHNNNLIDNIKNYIIFLQNIIKNDSIQLIIINCGNDINDIVINNLNSNLSINIFNYSQDFSDSIYNDILQSVIYDNILFTNYNVYFTNILIDWINNNKINEDSYVKTNIFTLKSLPKQFFTNFSDSIYKDIASNINTISNESGIFNIDSDTYINIFNNNKDLHILDSKTLVENNTLFIQNTTDFLLINKNTLNKIGFNINNSNFNHTFQYLSIMLIKNNLNMIKLPYIISVYKQFYSENETFINIDSEFYTSTDFNKFINYKIYNLNTQKTSSIIRNQVKTIKGYNTASTVQENELLKKKINELNTIIENYKNTTLTENVILDTQQNNHLTEQNNHLTKQNTTFYKQNKIFITKNNDLTNKNNDLNNNNNDLTNKNNDLTKQNNDLTNKNNDLTNKNNDLTKKNNDLTNKNNDLNNNNNNNSMNHLINKNNILTNKNNILTKQNNDLNKQNKDLTNKNSNLSKQNKSLSENNNDLIKKTDNFESNLKTIKNNILLKLYDIINSDLD